MYSDVAKSPKKKINKKQHDNNFTKKYLFGHKRVEPRKSILINFAYRNIADGYLINTKKINNNNNIIIIFFSFNTFAERYFHILV